jgi:hypothetical protein
LWQKSLVEHDGNVIGGADTSSILPGDFILPSDETNQGPFIVSFESLDLFAAVDSVHTTPTSTPTKVKATPLTENLSPRIQTYSALTRFTVEVDGEEKREVNVSLAHDVHFVTAFPCISSPHTDILKSPTSPSFVASHPSPPLSPLSSKGVFLNHYLNISRLTKFRPPSSQGLHIHEASIIKPPLNTHLNPFCVTPLAPCIPRPHALLYSYNFIYHSQSPSYRLHRHNNEYFSPPPSTNFPFSA